MCLHSREAVDTCESPEQWDEAAREWSEGPSTVEIPIEAMIDVVESGLR